MNNNKNIKNIADKCQIFTPENYVKELLDSVGYCKDILDKTILENSCVDGNILVEIVKRYIKEAIKQKTEVRLLHLSRCPESAALHM